ncbi:MAG: insulinase family protein [Phycisphaerales bacterium]|nr:insulinase family protein [Phycisphaerales bacterium]
MPTRARHALPPLLAILALAPLPVRAEPEAPPAPAGVVELHEARRSGVVSALLANGVLVHARRMDSPLAHLVVTVGGAEMLEDASSRGVSAVLAQTLSTDRIEVAAGPEAIRFRVVGSADSLEAAASELAAMLNAPAPTEEAIIAARERVLRKLDQRHTAPRARVREAMAAMLAPKSPPDARLAPFTPEQIARVTPSMVRDWLARHTRAGGAPVEAAIVGDLPLERALAITRKALGGLPARPAPSESPERKADMKAAAWPGRPVGPLVGQVEAREGEPGRAVVLVGYLGPDPHEISRVRTLRAAARLMERAARDRLTAVGIPAPDERVGAGMTSSPQPGHSMLLLSADVPEDRAADAAAVLRETFAAAAAVAPDAADLKRQSAQLTATLESFGRDAGYWASLLGRATAMGLPIDGVGAAEGAAFYRGLTPEAVRAAVSGLVNEAGRVELIARPAKK